MSNSTAAGRPPTGSAEVAQVGSAVPRHRLGMQLRQLREGCSLRLEEVAARLEIAPSTLSRIETGNAPTRASYLLVMLDMYGVTDPVQHRMLVELARAGRPKEWADPGAPLHDSMAHYLGLKAAAAQMCTFSVLTVPELLHTAAYAAAVVRALQPGLSAGQVHRLTQMTLRRQEQASRRPMQIRVVIDQAALIRPIGSPHILAEQLDHLLAVMASGHVTLYVIALATPWPVLSASFTMLSFQDPADPDLACWPVTGGKMAVTSSDLTVNDMRATFSALMDSAMPASASVHTIKALAERAKLRRQP